MKLKLRPLLSRAHSVVVTERGDVEAYLPLHVATKANQRGHYMTHARRSAKERDAVGLLLGRHLSHLIDYPGALRVDLIRIAPGDLDDDNLPNAFKAVRDEIAAQVNRNDGKRSGIAWTYDQRRGEKGEYAIEVRVTLE